MLRAKIVMGQTGKFFFAFLCVSEHFELTETHFFFNFCEREVQYARKYAAPDCDTSDSDLLV